MKNPPRGGLYDIPPLARGKPWHFKYLTVNHIYHQLAESNGKVLELLRALKAKGGDQKTSISVLERDWRSRFALPTWSRLRNGRIPPNL
jgi:hypothetical protein